MKKNMVILLAPDSFKECLSAKEVCEAMEKGIKKFDKKITCLKEPMSDGGEGTMQSLIDSTKGSIYETCVLDPLGNEIIAKYGILGDNNTGIIDMASASGIQLVPLEKRNPSITTTYGTGQLIKACLDKGINKLLIGIGGSATIDGGSGAMQALGIKLLDIEGNEIGFGGGELCKIHKIDARQMDKRLKDITIEVICDVVNPLCGNYGAAKVFGRQKGATKEMINLLDNNLRHYANVIKEQLGKDVLNYSGSGSAGGLGAGLKGFLNCELKMGIDVVIEYSKIEEKIKRADMIWTGEGRIDYQTQYGKTIMGIAKIAKKHKKPIIALAGEIGDDIDILYEQGISSIFCILRNVKPLEETLKIGRENIEKSAENIIRLIKSFK